jgi:sec-independent protein translocase protein TatB
MFNLGAGELLVIAILALVVLGPERIPGAMRTMGRMMGELRRLSTGFQDELRHALDDEEELHGSGPVSTPPQVHSAAEPPPEGPALPTDPPEGPAVE